jgi:hypothetical protein
VTRSSRNAHGGGCGSTVVNNNTDWHVQAGRSSILSDRDRCWHEIDSLALSCVLSFKSQQVACSAESRTLVTDRPAAALPHGTDSEPGPGVSPVGVARAWQSHAGAAAASLRVAADSDSSASPRITSAPARTNLARRRQWPYRNLKLIRHASESS